MGYSLLITHYSLFIVQVQPGEFRKYDRQDLRGSQYQLRALHAHHRNGGGRIGRRAQRPRRPDRKHVTVEWDEPATWEQIEALLEEINYPPAK